MPGGSNTCSKSLSGWPACSVVPQLLLIVVAPSAAAPLLARNKPLPASSSVSTTCDRQRLGPEHTAPVGGPACGASGENRGEACATDIAAHTNIQVRLRCMVLLAPKGGGPAAARVSRKPTNGRDPCRFRWWGDNAPRPSS